ncbi:NUDIX hydrolase [Clostridium ganghwense]|uniref:CoA pyrophosphatase n=1 Tax=Clostridium ganghwense TaxID=312089 RepID=A0ABT4CP79_9CLOT|nr:CoA pyrophosphatase [Clostridium ganghwense]MCY6370865.1 CoA pyrophosphatase [Clostridium ganghwense]
MEKIKKTFIDRKAKPIGKYRNSAVMILLIEEEGETYILFEKRALTLKRQPGDISLPGGLIEENETPMEAAMRETEEELNVKGVNIELIGPMDYFISPYYTIMYPFVGKLHTNQITPNKDEVDHVFKVPLKYFLENEPMCYKLDIGPKLKDDFPFHLIEGGRNYKFGTGKINEYFYLYDDYVIWGFTALIIKRFVEILKEENYDISC